jgi:hypothetical protein
MFVQFQILARQQAQREEELAQSQRHILALQVCLDFFRIFISNCPHPLSYVIVYNNTILLIQEEIEELEHENRLHSQQV